VLICRKMQRASRPQRRQCFLARFSYKVAICQEQFELKEIGATIAGVNIRDLKRVILPVPLHHGQSAIVGFLEEQAAMTNDSLDQALGESACPANIGSASSPTLLPPIFTCARRRRVYAKNPTNRRHSTRRIR
jgi:hypothetical protein